VGDPITLQKKKMSEKTTAIKSKISSSENNEIVVEITHPSEGTEFIIRAPYCKELTEIFR
jgi:hypothetical protein